MTTEPQTEYKALIDRISGDLESQPNKTYAIDRIRTAVRELCKAMPLILYDRVEFDYNAAGQYRLQHSGLEFVSVVGFWYGDGGANDRPIDLTGNRLVRTVEKGEGENGEEETVIYMRHPDDFTDSDKLYFSWKCTPKGDSTAFPTAILNEHWELIKLGSLAQMERFAYRPPRAPANYWQMKYQHALDNEREMKEGVLIDGGPGLPFAGGEDEFYGEILPEC